MTSFRSHKLLHRIVLGNLLVAALLCFATWLGVHANYRADMDLGVAVTRHQARSLSLELAAEVRLVDNAHRLPVVTARAALTDFPRPTLPCTKCFRNSVP